MADYLVQFDIVSIGTYYFVHVLFRFKDDQLFEAMPEIQSFYVQ